MSKRSPKSVEEKLEIVHLYLEQGKSMSILTKAFGVNGNIIRNWIRKYQTEGVEGFKESHSWKKYTSELKEKAVTDYLTGRGSLSRIKFSLFLLCPLKVTMVAPDPPACCGA